MRYQISKHLHDTLARVIDAHTNLVRVDAHLVELLKRRRQCPLARVIWHMNIVWLVYIILAEFIDRVIRKMHEKLL